MKRLVLSVMAVALLVVVSGSALAAGVHVDKLTVLVSNDDASYAADIINKLGLLSPDVEVRFIVTEADAVLASQLNNSVNADPANKILQVVFGTTEGGLGAKALPALFVSELEDVPGDVEVTITNPDPDDLTDFLNGIDPDNVVAKFVIIDPDPTDAGLLLAATSPSNDDLYLSFLLTNPDPFTMLAMLFVAGVPLENTRFTTTFSLAF